MREIKFRAWDESKSRMLEWAYLRGYCDVSFLFDAFYKEEEGLTFEYPVPLQYTGLKDMNGKDIYEGDLIDYEGIHKQDSVSKTILIVRWSEQDASFTFGGIRTDYAARFGKVIGNVYENPEFV